MKNKFAKLFEETKVGKLTIKNRIAMAPMGMVGLINNDGTLSQRTIDYFVERAKGGVGLIITGMIKVENEMDKVNTDAVLNPSAWTMFSELADAIHVFGSKIFVQLSAGYGSVNAEILDYSDIIPVSASSIPSFWKPSVLSRALTVKEIKKLIKHFGFSAKMLKIAGVDGVELHGHEGYLFDQFATKLWNKRTDKYGGNLERRLTFILEVLKAIKENAGDDFPVVYRYGLKHYIKKSGIGALKEDKFKEIGRDIKEGIEIAKILEKAGINGLHVDAGAHESLYWPHPPVYLPYGCMIDMTEQVKKAVVKIPIIAVGKLGLPDIAIKVIREDKADIIALGRALLADPYWPNKVKENKVKDIRPCICCHDGCMNRIVNRRSLSCAVNPRTGKEKYYNLDSIQIKKKVLVIGGGISGMEAARISATRGHNVTLYEKSNELGGHLIAAGVLDFKQDIKRLLEWYKKEVYRLKIKIKKEIKVTPDLVKAENPDIIIVATGSTCVIPQVKNIQNLKAITGVDLLLSKKTIGENILILGGGVMGCEIALWLAQNGKIVTVIEKLPKVAQGIFSGDRDLLLTLLLRNNVKIFTNSSIVIENNKVVVVTEERLLHKERIPFDNIIVCVGLRSEDSLYNILSKDFTEVYKIGDCKEPRKILDAIWDGYYIGNSI